MAESLPRVAQEIMETVPSVMSFIRDGMRRHSAGSLSVPQFRSLNFIRRHPGAALVDVAEHLGVTLPTASTGVERLVKQGLVERRASQEERRRNSLTLTPAGQGILDAARLATREQVEEALARLTPAQLSTVDEALRLLGGIFKEKPACRRSGDAQQLPDANGNKGQE